MARSVWNGTITFGLIAVQIKVHSATEDRGSRAAVRRPPRFSPADAQSSPSAASLAFLSMFKIKSPKFAAGVTLRQAVNGTRRK